MERDFEEEEESALEEYQEMLDEENRRKLFAVSLPILKKETADVLYDTKWELTWPHKLFEQYQNIWFGMPIKWSGEIVGSEGTITLCFSSSSFAIPVMKGSTYAIYPECEIKEIPDYYDAIEHNVTENSTLVATATVGYKDGRIFPLKTYKDFSANPFESVAQAVTEVSKNFDVVYQVATHFMKTDYEAYVGLIVRGWIHRVTGWFNPKVWMKTELFKLQEKKAFQKRTSKITKSLVRITVASKKQHENESEAETRKKILNAIETIFAGMSIQNDQDIQSLEMHSIQWGVEGVQIARDREVVPLRSKMVMSANELAGLFNFPDSSNVKSLNALRSRRRGPDAGIPIDLEDDDICFFGETNFRGQRKPFGIHVQDRKEHVLVSGSPGSGKSRVLEALIDDDLQKGRSVVLIDQQGTLYQQVLKRIPRERIQEVALFDPSDSEYSVALNPFDTIEESSSIQAAQNLVETFKLLFQDQWNDRVEHLLYFTVLALLPNRYTTCFSIGRMLDEEAYRARIVSSITDPHVRNFFQHEYARWERDFEQEAVLPLKNMIGELVENELLYNCLGQPTNSFHFQELISKKSIFLVKLDENVLGQRNASLLGSFVVNRLFQAAIARGEVPEGDDRAFHLYIDEFEKCASGSFEEVLSGARKFGLYLTLSLKSFKNVSDPIQRSLLANVGHLITLRNNLQNSRYIAQELGPYISPEDVEHLKPHEFFIRMSVHGKIKETFSGLSQELPELDGGDCADECLHISRQKYSVKTEVARDTMRRWEKVG